MKPTHEIMVALKMMESMQGQAQLLGILLHREGPNLHLNGGWPFEFIFQMSVAKLGKCLYIMAYFCLRRNGDGTSGETYETGG